MDRQLMPMPPVQGVPFEWLNACLEAAFPTSYASRTPTTETEGPARTAREPGALARTKPAEPEPALTLERRGDSRSKVTLYRSAMLRWQGKDMLCLIRNLSASGMMCRSLAQPSEGDRLEIEMRSGERVPGVVAWARDGQIGIRFDAPIDVDSVLNPRSRDPRAPAQRMPRLRTACAATQLAERGAQGVTLLDLSQGGAKVEAPWLREGERVTLGVVGLSPRSGTVRWVQGNRAGIEFLSPIPFDRLADWALQQPGDQRVGTGSAPE